MGDGSLEKATALPPLVPLVAGWMLNWGLVTKPARLPGTAHRLAVSIG